ncbi:hypothetical protein CU098_012413, partial [Rhizopus stolonifer]
EDFKEAKIYKELGDRLTGLWRFLINLESDKQQAVVTKDYDEAEKIKKNRIPDIQSAVGNEFGKLSISTQHKTQHPDQLLDEAIANWTSFDALSINNTPTEAVSSPSLLSARIPIHQVPVEKAPLEQKQVPEDPELVPEPLTADDIESCELAIDQFGQELVARIMSVKVKCRQNGLNQLSDLIQQQESSDLQFIQASISMIQEAIMDSRESIFNQAIQSWKTLFGK